MEEFPLELHEKVTAAVRKHWFVFLVSLLPFVFLAWLPLLLPGLAEIAARANPEAGARLAEVLTLEHPWTRLVLGLWWLLMWIGAFNTFTQYYLDLWVITTTRIVYIHQRGFFNREVSSFLLNRVQDVSTEIRGLFPTLLGYGSLRIETAGNEDHFVMHGIADPKGLRDLVMKEIATLHADGTKNVTLLEKIL